MLGGNNVFNGFFYALYSFTLPLLQVLCDLCQATRLVELSEFWDSV